MKNYDRVIKLDDSITGFNRFNRTELDEHFEIMTKNKVVFSDFHMPRPYATYENIINDVFNRHKKHLQ